MLTVRTPDYGDPVPNKPKYPGRHLRMDGPRWEGFGIHSNETAGDRTKELVEIVDYLLYAPGAQPPRRVPPGLLISGLRAAAIEIDLEADNEPDEKKRESLREKAKAQREMAKVLVTRARELGLPTQ